MSELPRYNDLPETPDGGRSAWGIFGPKDSLGLVNLMTTDRVARAARLVRRGELFRLDAPIGAFDPPVDHPLTDGRGLPRHHLIHTAGTQVFDDLYDNLYLQGSSQWDSLGHFGYAPNAFYNGATEHDVATGARNTIEHWARHGIVGRAVLLDMPRTLADAGQRYEPQSGYAFSVDELERARQLAGVEFEPGDVLILHTGFASWYLSRSVHERKQHLMSPLTAPGLSPDDDDMLRYLWDAHVVAVASDTYAVEAVSSDVVRGGNLHRMLIGQLGMALGELWWTEDLAADCAADGVYESFLTSAPLYATGAIGSPPNAFAMK